MGLLKLVISTLCRQRWGVLGDSACQQDRTDVSIDSQNWQTHGPRVAGKDTSLVDKSEHLCTLYVQSSLGNMIFSVTNL